jgi:cation diffusion facilitator CzcD-associated flavoprotein CzcO
MTDDRSSKYCIIGGGSSGLAALKNFRQLGIPCDCLERNDDVGGNWYYGKPGSSVYASTHLISSKRLTEYTDFPMPREWPDFPSRELAWEYLRNYAKHFGLYDAIEFNTSVDRAEPDGDGWLVTLSDGHVRRYRGVVIANGHNWDPKWPSYPGKFTGTVLHSCQYKTPDVLWGKRVLVVGGGNSGCDIAVESAQHAAKTFHSLRRGYHYVPKFVFGRPADAGHERYLRWGVPLFLRRFVSGLMTRLILGRPERFGLPKPDHKLFESHPIINSQMFYYAGHGRLKPKPDIAELCDDRVRFVDGSEEPIDVIIYATGFNITLPFIDRSLLNWHDGRPELFLNVFHPERDNLFVIGLIQPDSGQWGLVDYQSQLVARFVRALGRDPAQAERLRRRKSAERVDLGNGIRYVNSTRHLLEVEHFSYRRRLQKLIGELS